VSGRTFCYSFSSFLREPPPTKQGFAGPCGEARESSESRDSATSQAQNRRAASPPVTMRAWHLPHLAHLELSRWPYGHAMDSRYTATPLRRRESTVLSCPVCAAATRRHGSKDDREPVILGRAERDRESSESRDSATSQAQNLRAASPPVSDSRGLRSAGTGAAHCLSGDAAMRLPLTVIAMIGLPYRGNKACQGFKRSVP
jgi:hypothetical protein